MFYPYQHYMCPNERLNGHGQLWMPSMNEHNQLQVTNELVELEK